jgi:outer membrane lipoprotein-sorting protein
LEGKPCFVIERAPRYENSGYSRQQMWVDQEIWQPLKIEFYNHKNKMFKTLLLRDYKQYVDKFWRPHEMYMENHKTRKTTTLLWSNYAFATGLSDRDFDLTSLQRSR